MTKKSKVAYVCSSCSSSFPKWNGQCFQCGSYNTLTEKLSSHSGFSDLKNSHYAGDTSSDVYHYDEIELEKITRFSSKNQEFDRALGGGFVPGAVIVLSGDPGVGKSTLTLQTIHALSAEKKCLYLSGEESLSQIKLRGSRLGIKTSQIMLASQTGIEEIITILSQHQPDFVVIDSIQTLYSAEQDQAPGSINQIRYCAHHLTKYAKKNLATIVIIGHVNKEGVLAGPKVFEHMVDTVLHLEGEDQGRYRLLRTLKNRFGPIHELGIFCMTKDGLKPVLQPSALFTNLQAHPSPGTIVTATWEGSRALLIEIQVLVVDSPQYQARRLIVGFDVSRLTLLLAVLSRITDWPSTRYDVFLNVVGGLKIQETATDAAIIAAVYSSLKNLIIPREIMIIGEIGLGGEMRPVPYALERVNEAKKHGCKKIILPKSNSAGLKDDSMIYFVTNLEELMQLLKDHQMMIPRTIKNTELSK